MKKRRRKLEEDHMDESWLLPYADMLTLLLALFIVLFAVSSVDSEKYQQMIITFNESFAGGKGVLEQPIGTENPQMNQEQQPDQTQNENLDDIMKDDLVTREQIDLKSLKDQLDKYIMENNLQSQLKTTLSSDGLLLTILDHALFHSGSAEVRADAKQLGMTISNMLNTDPPRKIVVAGHTDNVPIHTFQFDSNWDLSSQRALNFMKILLEHEGTDPKNYSATGYGEYHPVAGNETDAGRAKNRRVEVHIMPNYVN